MKVTESIKFEGKNLTDVFNLPCVDGIIKGEGDKPVVFLKAESTNGRRELHKNEYLCKFDSGLWQVFGKEAYDNLNKSGRG